MPSPWILARRIKKPRPASRCFRIHEVGRGCAYPDSHGEPGFFVIGIEKLFSYRSDWHQDNQAKPLVRQYHAALDSLLGHHPELKQCAVHCVDCGIRFLTHPRNARRTNLRCPFGCRRHHRRRRCNERSAKHYATPHGGRKKKRLNARRTSAGSAATPPECDVTPPAVAGHEPSEHRSPGESPDVPSLALEGVVLDESTVTSSPMLPHIRMMVSLIEGIELDRQQLVDCLVRALRQHSIARRRRADYVLTFLNQHPP